MPAAITDTQPAKRSVGNVSGIDMGISNSIRRAGEYYSRHGLLATIRRAGLGIQRALFASRLVVFYCDLPAQRNRPENVPMSLRIHRLRSEAELGPQGLEKISTFWNPRQARKNIKERFAKGATLWVVKSEEQIAGFGWSLQGSTLNRITSLLGRKMSISLISMSFQTIGVGELIPCWSTISSATSQPTVGAEHTLRQRSGTRLS